MNEDRPHYTLDKETHELVEAALNCLVSLADAQIDETSRDGLLAITDTLADTFGVDRVSVEVHRTDSGEEIIYRPPRDLFGDDEDGADDSGNND